MGKKKISLNNKDNSKILPLLALDNYVVTPFIPQPIKIENEQQKELIDKNITNNSEIFIGFESSFDEKKDTKNLKPIGIIAIVDRILQMPGAPTLAFVRPVCRAFFQGIVFNPICEMARVIPIPDIPEPKRKTKEMKFLLQRAEELYHAVMRFGGQQEQDVAQKLLDENSQSPLGYLYALSHVAPVDHELKYEVLECDSYTELLQKIVLILDEAEQKISLQAKIHERTHMDLTQQQKEAFLRTQIKHIREELGETEESNDIADLISKASQKNWSKETAKHFDKELQKLRKLNINNPEYSVIYAYLEAFLELPWNNYKNSKIDLNKVQEILDRDHYGLQDVKERILEYMAVAKLRNDLKAPILCLYGPPGVGKTSIGKSVAEATGREYARIALGGMHDEAEIRGHRRTYIGAMPGRFLHSLSKLKFGNPLILLDEIDKVGKDFKGDPSSALLEALDPEQNNTFHDNFIDFPYDLSKVLFIATANDLSTIPAPLRDRMEVIEMKRYTLDEKKEIAIRHLIDKSLEDNGFNKGDVRFTPEAIETIIRSFTHEAGVRQLAKNINAIIRKLALQKVRGNKLSKEITEPMVKEYLSKSTASHSGLGFH